MKRLTATTFAGTFGAFAALLLALPTPPPADVAAGTESTDGATVVIQNVSVFDGAKMHPPTSLLLADGKVAGFGDGLTVPPSNTLTFWITTVAPSVDSVP
ncbi:MAG: hypothetical protein AAFN78_10995, partial [Pseudomonadota bacterium]